MNTQSAEPSDLGDLVIVLLAGTLAELSQRLQGDNFHDAAALVHRLVEEADAWIERKTSP